MKSKSILVFTLAILLLVAGLFFLSGDILTPYVSFSEAAAMSNRQVQVIGTCDRSIPTASSEGSFTFILKEGTGARMKVFHRGTRPLNFEHAEQIVVIGSYDNEKKMMIAGKILTKCPSKYEKQVQQQ